MIQIAKNIDKNLLAQKHWKWLSKKIRYDEDETSLKNEAESTSTNKILALRDILRGEIYQKLEEIITSPISDLMAMKSDPIFENFFPPSREALDRAQNAFDQAKKEWHDKNEEVNKTDKNDPIRKQLEAERRHLNQEKNTKKAERDKEKANYDKLYEKYLNTTTRTIKIVEKNETEANQENNGKKKKERPKKIKVDLEELLCYGKFHDNKDTWNANVLCNELGVSVCPYCNRQHISVANTYDGKWVSSAQIDHFLPKSLNPLFSCSFFNLIPSCYCCNHGKSNNTSITIHPYTEEFGKDGSFCLDYIKNGNNIKLLNLDNPDHFILHIDVLPGSPLKEKIENSIEVFHLNDLYKAHHVEIKDFILRYRSYKEVRLEDCKKIGLNISESDLQDIFLGFPIGEKDAEYPFRKMKEDLFSQLTKAENTNL